MPTYHEDPPRGLLSVTPTSAGESLRRLASTTRGLSGLNVAPATLLGARAARTHGLVSHAQSLLLLRTEASGGGFRLVEDGSNLLNRAIHYLDVLADHPPVGENPAAEARGAHLWWWGVGTAGIGGSVSALGLRLRANVAGDIQTLATMRFAAGEVPQAPNDEADVQQVRRFIRLNRDLTSTDTRSVRVEVTEFTRVDSMTRRDGAFVAVSQLGLLYRAVA